ncbi:hypothetical protein CCHR01_13716 [Colletotrichum chrysophilum]|uniref:Uncharacterized protein n=1 Tax=Colletotrichum chrysophilum TaxID=1836956 RepID=A0AAD9ADQ1_9PEZI|nr:hypothetical protein CCHR01_13716 [Colletotrichum chrysophilum]
MSAGKRRVKSVCVKDQEEAALSIWLTDELWLGESDIFACLAAMLRSGIAE